MKVGFIGIGLIGGSMLKRLSSCGVDCYILDTNKKVLDAAIQDNNAKILTDFSKMDILLLALSPSGCINFIQENHSKIGTTLLADVCGVKSNIQNLAKKYNLNYCGLHPMAGREVGGYFNSKENLFNGANIVITTPTPPQIIYEIIHMLGFGKIVYSDATTHDRIISYTSQLCHIISNSYAKNPCAEICDGFTGGSFEDLTRVGKMDSDLWVQLFENNKENLILDIKIVIEQLQKYIFCLENNNSSQLKNLIEDGNNILNKK